MANCQARLGYKLLDQYARTLNVSPNATDEEIHRAYRKLASTHHPDLGGNKDEFQKIQNAYEQLLSQRGKAARDNRHYGAAAVARQRNDELRKEKQRKSAAATAANQAAESTSDSPVESHREAAPTREQQAYAAREQHAYAARAAAERQRRHAKSFMTRKLPLQDQTTVFILVNSLDIFMTYVLISLGAIEANPIANYFLEKYNFNGLIFFKLVIVAAVCVIAQIIAAKSVRKGKDLLNFGSLLVAAVVAYSCWLLVEKFL